MQQKKTVKTLVWRDGTPKSQGNAFDWKKWTPQTFDHQWLNSLKHSQNAAKGAAKVNLTIGSKK